MTAPITTFGDVDEATMSQARTCAETGDVHSVALMADNHKGYAVPIGGVVAYRDQISPSGVGFDIACGVKAVKTNLTYNPHSLAPKWERAEILREIKDSIAFGIGRQSNLDKDAVSVMESTLWKRVPREVSALKQMAFDQLGSVGSGNHYIDLLTDDEGTLWVACHFGSRGFGHKIATHFLKACNAKDGMDVPPAIIDGETQPDLFDAYINSMKLAGEYAYAGRDLVIAKVLDILGAESLDEIHNHHNFAWSETHDDELLWVVRKGATPAAPGQRGFVGGSMGDIAAVVVGTDTETARTTTRSTVHGAGRTMSRTAAKGKYHRKTGVLITPGRVDQGEHDAHMAAWDVVVLGGELDESPFAYRSLQSVLDAQGDSIEVETKLRPIAVAMAGGDEFDPYKD